MTAYPFALPFFSLWISVLSRPPTMELSAVKTPLQFFQLLFDRLCKPVGELGGVELNLVATGFTLQNLVFVTLVQAYLQMKSFPRELFVQVKHDSYNSVIRDFML